LDFEELNKIITHFERVSAKRKKQNNYVNLPSPFMLKHGVDPTKFIIKSKELIYRLGLQLKSCGSPFSFGLRDVAIEKPIIYLEITIFLSSSFHLFLSCENSVVQETT